MREDYYYYHFIIHINNIINISLYISNLDQFDSLVYDLFLVHVCIVFLFF